VVISTLEAGFGIRAAGSWPRSDHGRASPASRCERLKSRSYRLDFKLRPDLLNLRGQKFNVNLLVRNSLRREVCFIEDHFQFGRRWVGERLWFGLAHGFSFNAEAQRRKEHLK
jgi:hypothetical protein